MAAMYQRVVEVISKAPEDRTLREIEPLLPWIRKKSDLFDQLKQDVVEDIIRKCEFVTTRRDDIIIKQGDKGDCFYVILTGKVSVFINQLISDEEAGTEQFANTHKGGTLDRSKFGNHIAHIDAGKSFGELALINKDCVRNASIIVDEATDLLVVNRELYNRSLRAAHVAQFEEKQKFIAENQLFHNWQPRYKKQLAMSLRKEIIHFDGNIVKQGDAASVLYLILRGTAKIIIDPSHHAQQYPNIYTTDDPDSIERSEMVESLASNKSADHTQKSEKPSSMPHSVQRKKEPRKKTVEISLVGDHEIIGDVEFGLELPTYIQSVVCMQQCEVYTLNMKNYERLVIKRNRPTVDQMIDNAATKLLSRSSRLSEIQVPLYRVLLHKICTIQEKADFARRKREGKVTRDDGSLHNDIVPRRGPLIDIFGPGTVFHRSRMREQARLRQLRLKQGNNFTGANNYGAVTASGGYFGGTEYDGAQTDDVNNNNNRNNQHMDKNDVMGHGEQSNGGPVYMTRSNNPQKQFHDWNTSDQALSVLEEKIKQWHAGIATKPSKDKACAIKLKRVDVEDGRDVKPGKKIFFRLKQPADKERLVIRGSGTPEHMTSKSGPIEVTLPNGVNARNMVHPQSAVYPTTEFH